MLGRQIAVGFGIAVIFPLLVYYGVATFYPPPEPADYFTRSAEPGPSASAEERKEYADRELKEHNGYSAAFKAFSRVLVLIATPIGVAAILIGGFEHPCHRH